MKSRIGVTIRCTVFETPAQTPKGIPSANDRMMASRTTTSVSMLSCHRPCRPMNVKPATASRATRQLPNVHATRPMIASTPR